MSDIKLVAFDVDGTLIKSDLWVRVNQLFGVSQEKDQELLTRYISGNITYHEWFALLRDLWRQSGRTKSELQAILHEFEFTPHAEELVGYLKGKYHLALVSSGFDLYVSEVAQRLDISHVYFLSKFVFDEEERFSSIEFEVDLTEVEAKVFALKDLQKRYKLEPHEIAFVGDSKNDIGAFEYTGKGILFGEGTTESLRQSAWKQVDSLNDIKEIL